MTTHPLALHLADVMAGRVEPTPATGWESDDREPEREEWSQRNLDQLADGRAADEWATREPRDY